MNSPNRDSKDVRVFNSPIRDSKDIIQVLVLSRIGELKNFCLAFTVLFISLILQIVIVKMSASLILQFVIKELQRIGDEPNLSGKE